MFMHCARLIIMKCLNCYIIIIEFKKKPKKEHKKIYNNSVLLAIKNKELKKALEEIKELLKSTTKKRVNLSTRCTSVCSDDVLKVIR